MAQSPEKYHRESADVQKHKPDADGQRGGDGLYQSYRYQQFRERQKKKQRSIDGQRVDEFYQNLDSRSFKDYITWMKQDNPLCVDCLEEGMIKPGRVMDHKIPIEQGGAVTDPDNLQWLCDHHHNIKRATEDRE